MGQPSENLNPPGNAGIALILLAAGASTRLGRPKQLLPFRGRSLLRHAAETALASVCRPVAVVLGASADRLQMELTALPVTVALNPAWAEGMAKSIRAGLKAVSSETAGADAVVIMLCDQPLITAGMLDRLVSVHRLEGRGIVASDYEGVLGAPALFSRKYYPELGVLEGNEGARRIIVKHEDDLARISLPEAAFDVDRMEEAARLGGPGWQSTPNSPPP
jgi:molybdenum cofactor cytidylyltransferase